jgi:hypothetical protein
MRARRRLGPLVLPWLLAVFATQPGCLWYVFLPDKADPPPDPIDTRELSHCRPHQGATRPVLLGETTGERTFACRLRNPADAVWMLSFPALGIEYVLAEGVDALTLARRDLPHATRPFEGFLELRLQEGGVTSTWRIVVVPHVDELFSEDAL